MYRNTYVEVDANILKENIREIKKTYPDYKYYIGVVKANAYGHSIKIVNTLIESGINYLAVSSLEEALEIRNINENISILCLEPINIKFIDVCYKNNITMTVSNYKYFLELEKKKYKGKIHLKLNTGMNRLGINNKEEVTYMCKNENVDLEGIYTHFATTGIYDDVWNKQLEKFRFLTSDVNLSKIPIVHLGRSLTLVNHSKLDFVNGIRLGIIMYGFNGSINFDNGLREKIRKLKLKYIQHKKGIEDVTVSNNLKLNSCFSLYSEVMEIHKISKGDIVGYGGNYVASDSQYIATIPIGYADGISSNIKNVEINKRIYNVVSICMDMIMIKVDETVHEGDKVIIIGSSLTVKIISVSWGVNAYHVFTGITSRVPRIIINEKK